MIERDIVVADDGRTLHLYDTGGSGFPVGWHHGTPNIGSPPEPLFADAERLGLRWFAYDRPGYGRSTPDPGRSVASAAADAAAVADALGIDRFAVMGHSGGGPHALACGALLRGRVAAVVSGAGLAPFDAAELDWFDGMGPGGTASLRAAAAGRAAKEAYEASDHGNAVELISADFATLQGAWVWFGSVVEPAVAAGPAALIDDDLAFVSPWGFDPGDVTAPVLLVHGGRDRIVPASHSEWLSHRCPDADLRLYANEGHVSVLRHAPDALEWLAERVG